MIKKPISRPATYYLYLTALFIAVLIIIFKIGFFVSVVEKIIFVLQNPVNNLSQKVMQVYNAISFYEKLDQENKILKEQNISLLQENNQIKSYQEENDQLKQILNYQKNNPAQTYLLAQVYARDPLNLSDVILIDKGKIHGIKIGQHVSYRGLYLGQIIDCDDAVSQVRLITSPNQVVIGQIADVQATGIVKGQIGFGLIMEDIPPDAALQPGQIVTTAAIDSQAPSNLLLGEIIEIHHLDQNIFQQASLKPFFDRKKLRFVSVQVSE